MGKRVKGVRGNMNGGELVLIMYFLVPQMKRSNIKLGKGDWWCGLGLSAAADYVHNQNI